MSYPRLIRGAAAAAMLLSLAACGFSCGARAASGALTGAGSGAAIGGSAGALVVR